MIENNHFVAMCARIRRVQIWELDYAGEGYWSLTINGRFPVNISLGRLAPTAFEAVKPLKGPYFFLIRVRDYFDGETTTFTFSRTYRAKRGIENWVRHD